MKKNATLATVRRFATVLLLVMAATAIRPALANDNWTISVLGAGSSHACAADTDNVVRCWGQNQFGQLGDFSFTAQATPVVMTGISGTVQAIAGGFFHTCVLYTSGTMQCVGHNNFGQLGDGTTVPKGVLTNVVGLGGPVADISAQANQTCALMRSGEARCWGQNDYGNLGVGHANSPVVAPTLVTNLPTGATAISLRQYGGCAIVPDGSVKCWGGNNGGPTNPIPTLVPDIADARRMASYEYQTCAITGDGGVKCWGRNFYGQLGIGSVGGEFNTPQPVVNLGEPATDVAVGAAHACAVLASGALKCWGNNQYGRTGLNISTFTFTPAPANVFGLSGGMRSVVAGEYNTCALTTSGRAKCWGDSTGMNGDGGFSQRLIPNPVGFAGRFPTMGLGLNHTCSRTWGLNLRCWGSNATLQLGRSDLNAIEPSPVTIPSFAAGMNQVFSGARHSCGLQLTGNNAGVKCWGGNDVGQLGNGTTATSSAPVDPTGLTIGVSAVTVGSAHSCALVSGGVQCWGDNTYGQLGDGSNSQRVSPVAVTGLGGTAIEVRAGNEHTCARLSTGAVRCWGRNDNGQLGNGSTTDSTVPVSAAGLPVALALTAGGKHTCASTSSGAYCWGDNDHGQIGDGNATDPRLAPALVTGMPAGLVKMVAAGGQHSCAIASDGRAYCWGANANGQLGDGGNSDHGSAALVSSLEAGVEGIYVGAAHSCAVLHNGAIRCWGANGSGQVGDGTIGTDRTSPAAVAGFGQALQFDAPASTPQGTFATTSQTSSALPITLDVATPATCTAQGGGSFASTTAGFCVLGARQDGDASFFPAATRYRVVRLRHLETDGLQLALSAKELDDPPVTLAATVNGISAGLPITYASLTPGVCTVSGNIATLVTTGSCQVQATLGANAQFAPQATIATFTVGAALPNQAITFDPLADRELSQSPFTVSATASSGLPVSFSSLTATCSVAGDSVSLLSTGTCTIRASQAGNASFSPAPDVDRSFTIAADPTQLLTVTRGGASNTDVITSTPAGIACPPTCSASFTRNATVTLEMDITNGRLVTVSNAVDSNVIPGAPPHVIAHASMTADTTVGFNFTNAPNQTVVRKGGGGGTITSNPAGINCGLGCAFQFPGYAQVTMTATPAPGAHVRGFSGGCVSGTSQCSFTVTGPRQPINATFSQAFEVMSFYRLGDDDAGAFLGNTAPGITSPQAPSLTGAILSRVGAPQTVAGASGRGLGVLFNGASDGYEWAGAAQDELDNFIIEAWAKATSPNGNGTITYVGNPSASGYGIVRQGGSYRGRLGGIGFVGDFFEGQWGTEQVHLALVRNNGITRFYINGNDAGQSSGATPVPPQNAVNAYTTVGFNSSDFNDFYGGLVDDVRFSRFEPGTFSTGLLNLRKLLITSFSQDPTVTVTTSPAGFVHPPGTTVRITVNLPAQKRVFNYNPACVVVSNTVSQFVCDATLNTDFNLNLVTQAYAHLTVVKSGTGSGTVFTTQSGDINCGPTCAADMGTGGVVLRANPDAGSTVSAWSHPLCPDPGDAGLCFFNLGADTTITVSFTAKLAQTIAFTSPGDKRLNESVPALAATATSGLPVSFASLTTGVCTVASNVVTLVATGTCTIRASQGGDATYAAAPDVDVSFQVTPATWIVTAGANGPGRVDSSPAGIACGATCSASFPVAQQVTLTATPLGGQAFYEWIGACAGQGPVCVLGYDGGDELTIARFGAPFEVIARWSLGEDDGGVPGTPAGATTTGSPGPTLARLGTPQFVAGAQGFGTATSFNRTDTGYYASTTISNATDNFGVEAWVKGDGFATGGSMIAYQGHGGTAGFGLLRADGAVLGLYGGNAVIGDPSEPLLQLGTDWKHVALVRVAGETRIYVNGVLVPSTVSGAGPNPANSNPSSATMIGVSVLSGGVNPGDYFGGAIDAVRYFRFAPTEFNTGRLNVRRLKATVNATPDALPVFLTDPPLTLGANNEGVVVPSGSVVRVTILAPVSARIVSFNPACAVVTQSAAQVVCDATLDADLDLTVLAVAERTLTIAKAGTGGGTVSSAPAGIDCGATCEATFTAGSLVTLTATPNASSIFVGWSLPACTGTAPCQVVLASSTTVTATFAAKATQSITFDPLANRTLAQTPFTVSATASSGLAVTFASTTMGVCTVSGASVTLLATGTCTIRASQAGNAAFLAAPDVDRSFEVTPSEFTLTVTRAGTGTGTVNGPGIACGLDCNEPFAVGANVQLTATPNAGSTFAGWSGGCSGTGACFLTMDAAKSVTATFTLIPAVKAPSDFDADGKSDLVFQHADGRIAVWLMNGLTPTASPTVLGAGSGFGVKKIADFDGNNRSDIVFQHNDGRVVMWLMSGTIVAGGGTILAANNVWTVAHTGDFNGDGHADILWRNTNGSYAIWLQNGTTTIGGGTILGTGTGWTATAVADFDGDGKDDIVWTNADGRVSIWQMNGASIVGGGGILAAGTGWRVLHTPDLNGDGKADIVWQHADGRVAVWLMNGTTITGGGSIFGGGTQWSVARTADFNGDGKADLLWMHADGRASIWLMDGMTALSQVTILPAGGWTPKRTADLNGDGKADILWQHTDGRISAWLMDGTSAIQNATLFGPGSGWSVFGP